VTAVPSFDEWIRVLETLSLPPEPSVLVLAPDAERELLQAIQRVRARAAIAVLATASIPGAAARPFDVAPTGDLGPSLETVDLVACDHAIDDIVVEAVARHEGLPPEKPGGGEYAPRPRAVRAYWRSGDLEAVAAPAFVEAVRSFAGALRPSGCIVFHHEVRDAHLTDGHPLDLYAEYLALARRWLAASDLQLTEVTLDTLSPTWWMCLRKGAGRSPGG